MDDSIEGVFQRIHPERTLVSFLAKSVCVYFPGVGRGGIKQPKNIYVSMLQPKIVSQKNHTDIFLTFLVYHLHFAGTDFLPSQLTFYSHHALIQVVHVDRDCPI